MIDLTGHEDPYKICLSVAEDLVRRHMAQYVPFGTHLLLLIILILWVDMILPMIGLMVRPGQPYLEQAISRFRLYS